MGARAGVDIGTNSCRLLVLDGDGTQVARELVITRLGRGVDETGHLDDEALRHTLETLESYRDAWREHGVDDGAVRVAATSAVRDAEDRDRFVDGVRGIVGTEPEILSGEQEAELAYRGAVASIEVDAGVVVLDVGGGSTELVVGGAEPEGSVSMQLGSVRLTERILRDAPPTAPQLAAARIEIAERIGEAATALRVRGLEPRSVDTLVGVAGTVTTLGMLVMRQAEYREGAVHGREIDLATVRDWSDRLLRMKTDEIAALGPVQAGREDVIAAGVLIVRSVMERLRFARLTVSETDGLDGLLIDGAA